MQGFGLPFELTILCVCMFVPPRLTLVSGLKWVDEVIPNAPYEITEEFMNTLFSKYNIDYIIHGDDPCLLPDGTDAYALAKKAGRYKQIRRTEGVSSTDIVGKITMWISKATIFGGSDILLLHIIDSLVSEQIVHFLKMFFMLIIDMSFFVHLRSYTRTISVHTGRILQTFKHKEGVDENAAVESCDQMKTQLSNFLPTSRRIMQFSNGQV